MVWKNLHIYIMYYVALTCITGSIWTFFWYIAKKIFKNNGNVKMIYRMLKLTMVGYALPVFFFAKTLYYMIVPQTKGMLWCASPLLNFVIFVLFIIWVVGVIVTLVRYIVHYRKFDAFCKMRFLADVKEKKLLEELKEKLHVRRNVRLYRGCYVNSPFVFGFIKPCIYLPEKDISEHSLEVTLTHELMHIKHNDVFWKPVFGFLCCIFWFNPLTWIVMKEYGKWAEAYCDESCYDNYFTVLDYFNTILVIMQENSQEISAFAPGVTEKKNELLWRVEIMDHFRLKKVKAGVASLAIVIVLLFNIGSTYALETGTEDVYSGLVNNTMKSEEEEMQSGNDDMQEYYGNVSDFGDDVVVMVEDGEIIDISGDSVISPQSADGTITGTLKKGELVKTGAFRKTANSTVWIAVTATPSDKKVNAGLIYPTGVKVYVQGSGNFTHTFSIPSDGAYMVFIENLSDATVKVNGIYTP